MIFRPLLIISLTISGHYTLQVVPCQDREQLIVQNDSDIRFFLFGSFLDKGACISDNQKHFFINTITIQAEQTISNHSKEEPICNAMKWIIES
jgi:hypothetical protein